MTDYWDLPHTGPGVGGHEPGHGNAYSGPTAKVECGHQVWDLLQSGLEVAKSEGTNRMGTEHLLLQLLRDPSMIPADALRAMGLDPSVVFARLAELATPRDAA